MRDKAALRSELLAVMSHALDTARAAIEGATHPEAKAENDKDTRGLEQSYLARGQAQRVAELEAAVAEVSAMRLRAFAAADPIAVGALVVVAEAGESRRYWLAPGGGGSTLAGDVQVITPSSPLGRALLGKHVDDAVELRLAGRLRELEIIDVQ
jgi:transcription elongation GreA/GreB family factor